VSVAPNDEDHPSRSVRFAQKFSWEMVSIIVGLIGGWVWFLIEQPFKDRAVARDLGEKIEVVLVKDPSNLSESELARLETEALRIGKVLAKNPLQVVEVNSKLRDDLGIWAHTITYDERMEEVRGGGKIMMIEDFEHLRPVPAKEKQPSAP